MSSRNAVQGRLSIPTTHEQAVRMSLRTLMPIPKRDMALARLAIEYARYMDAEIDVDVFGPKLLQALEALLLTPRARKLAMKGANDDSNANSPLDELKERREERIRRTNS